MSKSKNQSCRNKITYIVATKRNLERVINSQNYVLSIVNNLLARKLEQIIVKLTWINLKRF